MLLNMVEESPSTTRAFVLVLDLSTISLAFKCSGQSCDTHFFFQDFAQDFANMTTVACRRMKIKRFLLMIELQIVCALPYPACVTSKHAITDCANHGDVSIKRDQYRKQNMAVKSLSTS